MTQAQHFYNVISGLSFQYNYGFGLYLDAEEPNGSSSTGTPSFSVVEDFVSEMSKLYNNAAIKDVIGIYTNQDTWANELGNPLTYGGTRLWVASPNGVGNTPVSFGGWSDWTLMQYSSSETVGGYGGFSADEQR